MELDDKVLVIAEAGVNHNGDIKLAKELVKVAAECGAHIVKFQTFKAHKLVTKTAEKAKYQKENSGANESQFEMLRKLELSEEMHFEILECCKDHDIRFLSTAFEVDSLKFLTQTVGLDVLKIPSGEITNGPLLHAHAKSASKIIMSTGMSNLDEIDDALAVLSHGLCNPGHEITSLEDCYAVYRTDKGQQELQKCVTLLHCTSNYPASDESVNLRAMDTLRTKFNLPVGYSDHTEGIVASVAAVARGATIIEKHFTLDRTLPGPDHKASIEPDELKELVDMCNRVTHMLGSEEKKADVTEEPTKEIARKSIVAKNTISVGDQLSVENLIIKRPGTGVSPMKWWDLLNSKATRNYSKDDTID